MTRVVIKSSDKTFCLSFCTEGHSGYANEGSDVVCAAISSTTQLAVNILEGFGVDLEIEVDENEPKICCEIKQTADNSYKKDLISNVIKQYALSIDCISQEYPKHVKLSTEV